MEQPRAGARRSTSRAGACGDRMAPKLSVLDPPRRTRGAVQPRYALRECSFHGCQFGLVSCNRRSLGVPILKPWKVVSNCPELLRALNRKCEHYRRNGTHDGVLLHAPCQGLDTQLTENYIDDLVITIHRAHACYVAALADAEAFACETLVLRQS